jgi:hypothetical protein
MIRKLSLRIYEVEGGTAIQIKSVGNLFNEITTENFPNIGNNMDVQI